MSSVSVESRCQMEEQSCTRNRSSQEDLCGHVEIEFKMSVVISRGCIDAFKRLGCGDCEEVLQEIVSKATKQNGHNVSIVASEETWRLEGCFCGVKEIRKALQGEIRRKQPQENNGELETNQQSRLENDRVDTQEIDHDKPLKDNSTLGRVEMEESGVGNVSDDQRRSNEEVGAQRLEGWAKPTLKSDVAQSNAENLNNVEEKNKRQSNLIAKSPEVDMNQHDGQQVTNLETREQLKKEGNLKSDQHSETLKPQADRKIYPSLPASNHDEHTQMQGHSANASQRVEVTLQNENKTVTNSDNSERRNMSSFTKEGTSRNAKCSGSPKLQVKCSDMPTSANMEHREHLKQTAKCAESRNSSAFEEAKTYDQDPDRICALATLPSLHIDKDMFYYLVRYCNQELNRISQKCDVFEPYKVGQGHKLAFEVKHQYDTDSVIAEFRQLYGKITVGQVDIPKGVDPESLKSLVEAMTEFKDVELRFVSEKRAYKIVGSYLAMQSAKKMLFDVIASNTYEASASTANRKTQPNVQIPTTPKVSGQTGSAQWYHGATNCGAVQVQQPRRSSFMILNESQDSLLFSASNSLTIEVKYDDLTRIHNVDVVVSCINKQLDIDGQLSDKIMKVAGPYVKTELLSLKQRQPFLSPGCLVHTSAGGLTGVKVIIHAVRPQVHEFPPNDPKSRDVLRRLFINCLRYTNDVLRLKSIGLPPVGFSFYGAQMVVNCFLQAVETFASTVANSNPSAAAQHQPNPPHQLTYIQLIANDHHCIGQLIQCIKQRL